MKKVLIGLFLLIGFCSCGSNCDTEPTEVKFLVEEKWHSGVDGYYRLMISDFGTKDVKSIKVGKYTFENTNPGDTLTLKF